MATDGGGGEVDGKEAGRWMADSDDCERNFGPWFIFFFYFSCYCYFSNLYTKKT